MTAEHVVTTCRSAAALALAAAVDVLAVATDPYSGQSIQSVLDRWGLVEQVVPLPALVTPGGVAWDTRAAVQQWASEAVEHRAAVRAVLAEAAPVVEQAAARWWDAVAAALRGEPPQAPPGAGAAPRGVGAPVARALRRRYTVPASAPARPTVAVVVRAGDRGTALSRVLDGLLEQTFTDWRAVVVDDGGDPAVVDALVAERRDELAGRQSVLHHRRALGPGAAANRGLRASDSELVLLLDTDLADDLGDLPGGMGSASFLQRAVAHLEDPLLEDDGVVVGAAASGRHAADPRPEAVTLTGVLAGGPARPGPFVYRRAVHGVLGDYDETLAGPGQWEFGLRFLETFTVGLLSGSGSGNRRERSGDDPAAARRRDELAVRERHLKQWTAEHGIGLPLHLGWAVGERTDALLRRLDAAEALNHELLDAVRAQAVQLERLELAVSQQGFVAFWRRLWQALVRR